MKPSETFVRAFDRFVRAGALIVALIGVAVTFGWVFDIHILKSVLPGLMTMKVNTACGFLAAGTALWLLHTSAPGSRLFLLGRALSAFVALLGALVLAEYIFAANFGIDQLLMQDVEQKLHPGRLAETTALSFFLAGIALFSLKARRPRRIASVRCLAAVVLFISTLAIVGYVYGVSSLYAVGPYSSMALHTAVAFLILGLSTLAADPTRGIAGIAASDSAGGVVVRRLLPIIPVAILVIGWVLLQGHMAGLYDARFGLALVEAVSLTVYVLAITWTAFRLHKVDLVRKASEAKVTDLNAGLEELLHERTEQVAQLTAALSANKALELLSLQDELTGIGNRRAFDEYLAGQISIARRQKKMLALVLCDVDVFKAYNDHYGHLAGDVCLKRVAAALQSCCRRPADMVARYGGEEFALILPDTELEGALLIAEAARDAVVSLKIPTAHSPAAPYVSISGGVTALVPTTEFTSWRFIAEADQALYQAKSQGRNRMVSAQAVVKGTPAAALVRAAAG